MNFHHRNYLLMLTWVLGAYCRPHHDDTVKPQPPSKDGVVCEKGIIKGAPTSKRIGVNGGTVTSADGQITITIPQGALSGDTTIEIQPITNTNPAGNGIAYRITPHGKIFKQPVSISFSYIYGEGEQKIPQVQGIAYQDDRGIWKSVGGGHLDTTAKKATIQTDHFSDWSEFEAMRLIPGNPVLKVTETVKIRAIRYIADDDLLLPLSAPAGKETPIGTPYDLEYAKIKNWRLSGVGKLNAQTQYADYTAPELINGGRGSAAVSVAVNAGPGQLLLISNISVINEGVVLRINGGNWIQFAKDACIYDSLPFVISGGNTSGMDVSVAWDQNQPELQWGSSLTAFLPGFVYHTEGGKYQYTSSYFIGDAEEELPSPGYLKFDHFSVPEEPYVSGSFFIEKGAKLNANGDILGNAKIEGYFRMPTK
ncbi:MAG: hypothetical protein J7623_28710 [Chitinophaga sp.]|uniref:hypothetical protein n=1 Tax=Chitinophaga sp. TaxID=1869181 RepID=UPI001B13F7D2|nr:hypothetical protein [Chitinophaga sp.]MBO9732659.1 hypothetical protein [Chitinophaga sp.]